MPVSSRQVITGRHAGLLSGERRLRSAPVHWLPAWVAVYPALLRTRCLTCGATPEEVGRLLRRDDLLPEPDLLATHAASIAALPNAMRSAIARL